MTPTMQKYIAGLLIILGLGLISQKTFAAATMPTAQDILRQMGKSNKTPYEQVELKMKIQEADGSVKERTLTIKKKSDKENKAMVKLLSPSDLKGVSLLTVSTGKGGSENQWLYLPSEKKSRRIVGSNKKGRFLDSELNYEDLSPSTYENFNSKVIDTKGKIAVIESTAKPGSESSYSKIKSWINSEDYRILKSEYYGEDGKLLKVMTFNGYKKYNNLWRAQNISVKNVKKNRSTILEMKKFSLKKMDDGEFSMSALEEG